MKGILIPLVVSGLFLAGCSSAYKTAQTPDDVYFSSDPGATERVYAKTQSADDYQNYWDNDDAYLRMKVRNGGRWNNIDDINYWYGYNSGCLCNNTWAYYNSFNSFGNPWMYNSLGYGGYYNFNNPWGLYNSWSYNPWRMTNWYYPSYGFGYGYGGLNNVVIVGSKYPVYSNTSRPRLSGYSNNVYDRGNSNNTRSTQATRNRQFRSIFESNNNSNNSNYSNDRPNRTFSPSPSSSSPSSSGSSGSSRSSGSGSSSGRGGRGG